MLLLQMSGTHQSVVHNCIRAILDGPYLDDAECHPRIGLWRNDLRSILARWPNLDDSDPDSDDTLAINNCLNEVCYGIQMSEDEVVATIGVSRDEVQRVFQTWKAGR
jgi:hypothetical protein